MKKKEMKQVLKVEIDYNDINYIAGYGINYTKNTLRVIAKMLTTELKDLFPIYKIDVSLKFNLEGNTEYYLDGLELDPHSEKKRKVFEAFDNLLERRKKIIKKIKEAARYHNLHSEFKKEKGRNKLRSKISYDDLDYITNFSIKHTREALQSMANIFQIELEELFPGFKVIIIPVYEEKSCFDAHRQKKIIKAFDCLADKYNEYCKEFSNK